MRRERGFAGGGWLFEQDALAVRMTRLERVWGELGEDGEDGEDGKGGEHLRNWEDGHLCYIWSSLLPARPRGHPGTGTRPVESGAGDGPPQRRSKGLKRLMGSKG